MSISSTEQSSHYPHPIIAKEGWGIILLALSVSIILQIFFPYFAVLGWIITIFSLQFFRDPARLVPYGEKNILSPADGRIVAIEETLDPYRQCQALKISVFMNVFNVHSNRSPVDGEIQSVRYFPGKFLNADLEKASLENERNALIINTQYGGISCVQIAGLVARRILCHVTEKQSLKKGQRYGFIRFGSRVDLYLPLDVTVKVGIGEKVSATTTVLAEFK